MKKKLFIFLLSFVLTSFFSQKKIQCVMLDSLTKQPIEYANIGIVGKNIGTVSNEKGEFTLVIPDSLLNQSIKISMIGYKAKTYSAINLEKQNTVFLSQASTVLNEVKVSAKKSKFKILGNDTKSTSVSAGFTKNNLGAEIGLKLNIKHPQTHILKLMFNISSNSINQLPLFRCNIYNLDKKGFPKDNILTQNIIIEPKEMTGFVEVDLSSYQIFVSEDVIISIEWIKDLGDAKGLSFSTKLIGTGTYFRQTSQDKWEKVNSIGVGLHAQVSY